MIDILWTLYLALLGTAAIAYLIKRNKKKWFSYLDFIISLQYAFAS
ncbi:hypothetical protein VQL36_09455 [Chengkuizengella sp. SCS-71B]